MRRRAGGAARRAARRPCTPNRLLGGVRRFLPSTPINPSVTRQSLRGWAEFWLATLLLCLAGAARRRACPPQQRAPARRRRLHSAPPRQLPAPSVRGRTRARCAEGAWRAPPGPGGRGAGRGRRAAAGSAGCPRRRPIRPPPRRGDRARLLARRGGRGAPSGAPPRLCAYRRAAIAPQRAPACARFIGVAWRATRSDASRGGAAAHSRAAAPGGGVGRAGADATAVASGAPRACPRARFRSRGSRAAAGRPVGVGAARGGDPRFSRPHLGAARPRAAPA